MSPSLPLAAPRCQWTASEGHGRAVMPFPLPQPRLTILATPTTSPPTDRPADCSFDGLMASGNPERGWRAWECRSCLPGRTTSIILVPGAVNPVRFQGLHRPFDAPFESQQGPGSRTSTPRLSPACPGGAAPLRDTGSATRLPDHAHCHHFIHGSQLNSRHHHRRCNRRNPCSVHVQDAHRQIYSELCKQRALRAAVWWWHAIVPPCSGNPCDARH